MGKHSVERYSKLFDYCWRRWYKTRAEWWGVLADKAYMRRSWARTFGEA